MTSSRQRHANRRNSKKSTGPKTAKGKRISKMNAGKHLVFSKEVVAGHEDANEFNALLRRLQDELHPETQVELSIVERFAATLWREKRLISAERQWLNENHQYNHKEPGFIEEHAKMFDSPTKIAPVDALPIAKQILIGRYQVMLTNQCRGLLDELRREQSRRIESEAIEGTAVKKLPKPK